ncbi:hypothetical protein C3L33_19984, partial [Rhododendron williamsianum]
MVPERVLSAESGAQLQEGISLVLSRWAALQMAVVNEWGGRDSRLKSQQLAPDIFSWFTQSKGDTLPPSIAMQSLLIGCLVFVIQNKDMQIAERLMIMHEECLEGNYQSIQILREADPPAVVVPQIQVGMVVDAPNFHSNLNRKEVMVDEPRPSETAEAEDGWTVVAPRRNRGTRN